MATLAALPTELLLEIAAQLHPASKLALSCTARRFRALPPLTRPEQLDVLGEREHAQPWKCRLVCSRCMRMLPAARFAHLDAAGSTYALRQCLRCRAG